MNDYVTDYDLNYNARKNELRRISSTINFIEVIENTFRMNVECKDFSNTSLPSADIHWRGKENNEDIDIQADFSYENGYTLYITNNDDINYFSYENLEHLIDKLWEYDIKNGTFFLEPANEIQNFDADLDYFTSHK